MKPLFTSEQTVRVTGRDPSGTARTRSRRSRRAWVVLAVVAQAILLAAGWAFTLYQVRARVADKFKDEIIRSNVATVEAVSHELAERVNGKIVYGDKSWDTAQSIVETLKLPAGGFACLVDDKNALLCHPDIRREPGLRDQKLGDELLETDTANGTIATVIGSLPGTGISTGKVTFNPAMTHYVATTYLPGLNARLLVHQPQDGLLTAGEAATSGLLWVPLAIGGVVLLCTGYTTSRLMARHDRDLESINAGLEREVAVRLDVGMRTRDALITGLAKLADFRDNDTGTHLDRIAEYSGLLARKLVGKFPEINDAWISTLRVASSLHDIGKVGVPDAILLKPGRFTPVEREQMERHPLIGTDTLIAVRDRMGADPLVDMSLRVALYHHERWDGSGYPTQIAGAQIPLEARIVSLADVYDALTSRRVYKEAMAHHQAVDLIRAGAGTQFDPVIVEAFLTAADEFNACRAKLQPAPDRQTELSKQQAG